MNTGLSLKTATAFVVSSALLFHPAFGSNVTWNGTNTSTWSTGGNWQGGNVPATSDTAVFSNAGNSHTTIDVAGVTIQRIIFDVGAVPYTIGTGGVNNQTLTLGSALQMNLGVTSDETVNAAVALGATQVAGSFTITNSSTTNSLIVAGNISSGTGAGTPGIKTLTFSGAGNMAVGGSITPGSATSVNLAMSGTGTLSLSGASTVLSQLILNSGTVRLATGSGVTTGLTGVGVTNGVTSTLQIEGGTHSLGNFQLVRTSGATGIVNQTGGAVTADLKDSSGAAGIGIYNISAGSLNLAGTKGYNGGAIAGGSDTLNISGTGSVVRTSGAANIVGSSGAGALNISGSGSFNSGSTALNIAGATGTGTISLDGGTLTVGAINSNTSATSTGIFNFNGGTLQSGATTATFFASNAQVTTNVRNGGVVIDTAGFNDTMSVPLLHSAIGGDNATDGGLTLNDSTIVPGTLTLSGANTFTGNTSVLNGTLNLANTLALQNSTLTTADVATFSSTVASHAFTFGGLSGSGNMLLIDTAGTPNAVALSIGNNNTNTTYSGGLSGIGSLIKIGTGTTILSGSNSYTGTTTIANGTLQLGTGATTGSLSTSSTISGTGGVFAIKRSNTVTQGTTFSGSAISGAVGLTQAGTGTTILTAANTYTGATTVTAGTLQLGNAGTTGSLSTSSAISGTAGTFAVNRTNTVTQGTDFSGSAISGAVGLTQAGTGTTVLTAANTYSGGTTVSAGSLYVNNSSGSGTGSGAVGVSNTATLAGTGTVSGATTFAAGSILSPGVSGGATLAFASALTLNNKTSGSLLFDLGTVSDKVTVGGLLTLNGQDFTSFTFNTSGGGFGAGTYVLFDASSAIAGSLGSNLTSTQFTGFNATLSLDNLNNDLVLTVAVVPEPSSWAMMLGGLMLLVLIQARRNKLS